MDQKSQLFSEERQAEQKLCTCTGLQFTGYHNIKNRGQKGNGCSVPTCEISKIDEGKGDLASFHVRDCGRGLDVPSV
jgi:hypothetical protein